MKVYLRPLRLEDAKTSWRWRNDAEVWRYTVKRPDRYITPDIECEWLARVLQETNSRRFAIMVSEDGSDTYVGNVQLTDIAEGAARMHVFIGERRYWGRGVGYSAGVALLEHAFTPAGLEHVRLRVHPDNQAALHVYQKLGFNRAAGNEGAATNDGREWIAMEITREAFEAAQSKPVSSEHD